ncbi:methyl-accepting chemotaxis protein [Rossellomorea vietnamensis]|uniref:Methyl-accepting chemotaxis protein n=1 Tax=Rossellomorea vietnamensis TaxID=218284 RepID=A0A5D4MGZ6_9BACI|nr:methyl-accepting chemotaxis protein [Rossellomorea vietnamensis]
MPNAEEIGGLRLKKRLKDIFDITKNRTRSRKDTFPEKDETGSLGKLHSKLSLQNRLLILFVLLLTVSIVVVGVSSYIKAKEATIETIENRLGREAELISYVAENLKFLYVSDDDYFFQQLEISIRDQKEQLTKDGIESDIFYISNNEVIPFQASTGSDLKFNETLVSRITNKTRTLLHETINGEEYTISAMNIKGIDGHYILAVPSNSYLTAVTDMAKFTLAVILISLAVSTILILLSVRSFTKPLIQLQNIMREVRNGNLNKRADFKTNLPEIHSLKKSFNMMIEQMRDVLHELNETTMELETTGGSLSSSSEEALNFSRELIEAINVVKHGAEQTASSSDNSVNGFQMMKQKIEQLINNMETVHTSAVDMNDSAEKGERNNTELIKAIHSFENDFAHMNTTIQQVRNHSLSIANLVGLIKGVAEQTKLLALNAAIEAARAGESGKGFAVVAEEVRKLADQSTKAAEDITGTIEGMEGVTIRAAKEFDEMLMKIKGNLDTASESKGSFDELMKEVKNVSGNFERMQSALVELKMELPQLEQATVSSSSVSQETLASTEQMLAASSSQIAEMENTHEIGIHLKSLSNSLTTISKRFAVK